MPLYGAPLCFEPASCAAVFKKPSGCLAGCGALRSEHGILHSFLKLTESPFDSVCKSCYRRASIVLCHTRTYTGINVFAEEVQASHAIGLC